MMNMTTGSYELNFDGAIDSMELGEEATRDHSDMKLVDFVVEFDDLYLFVQVIREKGGAGKKAGISIENFKSDRLCDMLARRYRDSMFFHSNGERKPKRVEYAVLFALCQVDEILVAVLEDELKRRIPLSHPVWQGDSAASCSVMTVDRWQKKYGADSIRTV